MARRLRLLEAWAWWIAAGAASRALDIAHRVLSRVMFSCYGRHADATSHAHIARMKELGL